MASDIGVGQIRSWDIEKRLGLPCVGWRMVSERGVCLREAMRSVSFLR
jgi:hypothetical protein